MNEVKNVNIFAAAREAHQLDRARLKREVIAAVIAEYESSLRATAAILRTCSHTDYDSSISDITSEFSRKQLDDLRDDSCIVSEYFSQVEYISSEKQRAKKLTT